MAYENLQVMPELDPNKEYTIEELTNYIRNATTGKNVREALARSMEATNEIATWARDVAQGLIDGAFDAGELATMIESKLNQLEQDYAPKLTSLETEIEDARGGETNLGDRLNEFSSQLAHIPQLANTFGSENFVRMIAHRGLSQLAPENTLPAYELAGRAGFWGAETDVSVTSDGHWVLMHDTTVDRTTNGTGNVSELTLSQIKELKIDVGNGISRYPNLRVPTLDEYLLTCKKFKLVPVIEIKAINNSSDYGTFVDLIRKHGFEEKCIVISFSPSSLEEIRNRSSKIMLQALLAINQNNLDFVKSLKNASINQNKDSLTKSLINLAHSNGVLVNTWTVNSYQEAKTLSDYGVDFITSDIISKVVI